MFLAENLKTPLSASIAFDWSNDLWAMPKPIYVNPQSSYFALGNPYTNRKSKRTGLILVCLLFFCCYKVIFFANAKSDIVAGDSDMKAYGFRDILFAIKLA